jgi:hypothetical protein
LWPARQAFRSDPSLGGELRRLAIGLDRLRVGAGLQTSYATTPFR